MTPKERITVAMAGGTPDRVPITLKLSEMVPVRFATGDYIEFFWHRKLPLWRARVETEYDRFGGDAYLHLGEDPSPHDPPVEQVNVRESSDRVQFTCGRTSMPFRPGRSLGRKVGARCNQC